MITGWKTCDTLLALSKTRIGFLKKMKPKILEEFKNLITPLQKEQKDALKQNINT